MSTTEPAPTEYFTLELHDFPQAPTPNRVRVRTSTLDFERIASGELTADETIHVTVPASAFYEDASRYEHYGRALTVAAEDDSIPQLLGMVEALRKVGATLQYGPEAAGDGAVVIVAASLGIPVRLDPTGTWSSRVLRGLADYYLRSPSLEAPIEPFFSVARAMGDEESRPTLWEISSERIGFDYCVTADGTVSLSRRWEHRGRDFGPSTEPLEQIRKTELFKKLDGLWMQLLAEQSKCAFCTHFRYCGGFWLDPLDSTVDCEDWKGALDMISSAFDDLEEI